MSLKLSSIFLCLTLVAAFAGDVRALGGNDTKERCHGSEIAPLSARATVRTILTDKELIRLGQLKKALKKDALLTPALERFLQGRNFGLYESTVKHFTANPERRVANGDRPFEWYRRCLGLEEKIKRARIFAKSHRKTLSLAQKKYNVDSRYIVSILGVESNFALNRGKFNTINALISQYLLVERRRKFAYRELKQLLRYASSTATLPGDFTSSYAGAIGCAQFIPSSLNSYFVGKTGVVAHSDPYSIDDCIYSVAYYLKKSGWRGSNNGSIPVKGSRIWKAIHAYNHSDAYTRFIVEMADGLD